MNEGLERAKRVLDIAYRGIYHLSWKAVKKKGFYLEVNIPDGISTFDSDVLTRLVVAAHDQAVRVEIVQRGPRMLKLLLHPRVREGCITKRHDTIEAAVDQIRAGCGGPFDEKKDRMEKKS